MRLVSYMTKDDDLHLLGYDVQLQRAQSRWGWLTKDDYIVDALFAVEWAKREANYDCALTAKSVVQLLQGGASALEAAKELQSLLLKEDMTTLRLDGEPIALSVEDLQLLPPIDSPPSLRDFYAFEAHAKRCREKRGLDMVPEWYQFPAFYFSNTSSLLGDQMQVSYPTHSSALDFELEVACVIGKAGQNIDRADAYDHVCGLMIMNDWSARDTQAAEMKVGLGPSKAKDFATSLGPCLVTLDELEPYQNSDEHWDLEMRAFINEELVSKGNLKDLYWSFAQMIEHASRDCTLLPGDILGSGTVGTGSLFELSNRDWLKPGDMIRLEVTCLGSLCNSIGAISKRELVRSS